MKMEILLEPTSNKLMVEHAEYDESNTYVLERFNTTAGNPVKKILLKLNLSDHRLFKMVEHVDPEVASSQDANLQDGVEIVLVGMSQDAQKDHKCQILNSRKQASIQEVNDHYNIFTRESQEYELKTKEKDIVI
ncbi:hypothetical protein Tco_0064407 [Tanacetum coccineum]